jgi:hypothetical protein
MLVQKQRASRLLTSTLVLFINVQAMTVRLNGTLSFSKNINNQRLSEMAGTVHLFRRVLHETIECLFRRFHDAQTTGRLLE